MSVILVILDVLIFYPISSNKKVYEGNLRSFEPNPPPILKFSLEKCSNLDYDYKCILKRLEQEIYK